MRNKRDDFDKEFAIAQKLAIGWFVFVGVIVLSVLGGVAFVVYKVLSYFGIL